MEAVSYKEKGTVRIDSPFLPPERPEHMELSHRRQPSDTLSGSRRVVKTLRISSPASGRNRLRPAGSPYETRPPRRP